jgi:hypothetical protein
MPESADVRAVGEFVASRHGVCTRTEASEKGLSKNDVARLIRDGAVEPLGRLVLRFTSYPKTWRQTVYAATIGGNAVASHRTAAALHRLDGIEPDETDITVTVPQETRSRRPGVVIHRSLDLAADDIIEVDLIRCTTIARTICDLANDRGVSEDTLIRVIDDVQRRSISMRWLLQTAERLQRRGRIGPDRVIAIVSRRLDGYRVPDSWFERLLERCLQSPVLRAIERQYVLRDCQGNFVARFDLALPWLRLGLEGHSRSFHLGERVESHDEDRDLRATAEGWEVVYLGFAATKSPKAVCVMIEKIATRRASDLGLAPPVPSNVPPGWTLQPNGTTESSETNAA